MFTEPLNYKPLALVFKRHTDKAESA